MYLRIKQDIFILSNIFLEQTGVDHSHNLLHVGTSNLTDHKLLISPNTYSCSSSEEDSESSLSRITAGISTVKGEKLPGEIFLGSSI